MKVNLGRRKRIQSHSCCSNRTLCECLMDFKVILKTFKHKSVEGLFSLNTAVSGQKAGGWFVSWWRVKSTNSFLSQLFVQHVKINWIYDIKPAFQHFEKPSGNIFLPGSDCRQTWLVSRVSYSADVSDVSSTCCSSRSPTSRPYSLTSTQTTIFSKPLLNADCFTTLDVFVIVTMMKKVTEVTWLRPLRPH